MCLSKNMNMMIYQKVYGKCCRQTDICSYVLHLFTTPVILFLDCLVFKNDLIGFIHQLTEILHIAITKIIIVPFIV